ncbi:otoferlin isoform X2 [Lepeophtheirus salmonis]|uniref:otoferlin isoform X2 n=1 Tax=Lepeophtheirus salmonis TaxID=72036 RepID=UPI003AF3598A
MSLVVKLIGFNGSGTGGDRIAKATFRGVSHISKTFEDRDDWIDIDEQLDWPIASPLQRDENISIHIMAFNRFLNNRLLGNTTFSLHRLLDQPTVQLAASLLDMNGIPLKASIKLEMSYYSPFSYEDDSVDELEAEDDDNIRSYISDDLSDNKALVSIERNIANIERNFNRRQDEVRLSRSSSLDHGSFTEQKRKKPFSIIKKRSNPLKTVRNVIRTMGVVKGSHGDEESLMNRDSDSVGVPSDIEASFSEEAPLLEKPSFSKEIIQETNKNESIKQRSQSKRNKQSSNAVSTSLRAQDFQVCITVIEARQLAGLNMDPVVCVQVGDQKKYTSVKESTNCPYYNEYFVFDFHMAPVMLYDKIITLSVLQRHFLRTGKILGSFKLDVATVMSQEDHQFYHKWALLTDPDDITGGPKGYLKCDINVITKGDAVKIPPKSERDEDDIEANLLLPDGVPAERQRAKYIVRIYRADGLPRMNSSIMANLKHAFGGPPKDLVDPYVQVSFAGLCGRTSVKKNSYSPVWNEQIVFTEMFPPLCQRIKIQLRESDTVGDTVIGTHFLDLSTISHDGDKGFLPTFGPAFVHLYGSTRDYSIIDEHSTLNDGLGEGVSYRGKILIALKADISDTIDTAPSEVEVEPTQTINESSYGKLDEFFLFGCIMEATMIDKKLADKPIQFEISMGNAGNSIDGHIKSSKSRSDIDSDSISLHEETAGSMESLNVSWQSTTPSLKPQTHDRLYYYLPYWDDKPTTYIRSVFPDHRKRMYNSNAISKIADKLEENLREVHNMIEMEDPCTEEKLKKILEQLQQACTKYGNLCRSTNSSLSNQGRTRLDRERSKLCINELENIGTLARQYKIVKKSTIKEKYKMTYGLLDRLRQLIDDPQHAIPDIFIWLISGTKRLAYQRIPSRNIIYSMVEEEKGKDSGCVQTLFLKLPGRKGTGSGGWMIQAKLQIYLWLGSTKHKKAFPSGIPSGFQITNELLNAEKLGLSPPLSIHYTEKYCFQLRAHMYQARSLIGSDASGLSDPFARVIIGEYCRTTQVIDETLSPTWDELLIFDQIVVYGRREDIKLNPPTIIIEIYDQDKVGKAEFLGRSVGKPWVCLIGSSDYQTPSLEWFQIYRGNEEAGELLAAFEMFELAEVAGHDPYSNLSEPKDNGPYIDSGPVLPVPKGIRPTLAKYRFEVLFWGLRDVKRVHWLTVDKPRVDIECAGNIIQSSVITNAKKNPNFSTTVKFLDIELPEQEIYCPPLTIRVVDCRSFGRYTLVGTHVINSIHKFLYHPVTRKSRDDADKRKKESLLRSQYQDLSSSLLPSNPNSVSSLELTPLVPKAKDSLITLDYGTYAIPNGCGLDISSSTDNNKNKGSHGFNNQSGHQTDDLIDDDEESLDWWSKYFASVDAMIEEGRVKRGGDQEKGEEPHQNSTKDSNLYGLLEEEPKKRKYGGIMNVTNVAKSAANKFSPNRASQIQQQRKKSKSSIALFKLFPNELESQVGLDGFTEWLQTFELYRGKKSEEEFEDETRIVGKFKGSIKIYKLPLPKDLDDHTVMGFDPQFGFFQGLPSNDPLHVLVRVYVVKANDLHPMDINGKADPYLVLQLGSKRTSDKENYISKQLNPIFGKCFEFEATFPQDSVLTVQVYDWDLLGSDDLIGETKIDLENRFFSRHRATCGLTSRYDTCGYNQWRDPMKPVQLLTKLCKEGKVDGPHFSNMKVRVGQKTFTLQSKEGGPLQNWQTKVSEEHLALAVLHHWNEIPRVGTYLVPEHIETRALFNPDKPGIEQGKLEIWVDMFPMDMPLPGLPVDISPRKPSSYELRVIIWNTDEVVLEDDAFFSGDKMSDIYVKGWLKGPDDAQQTDVHYRSLTGEGNFNWRFLFPFEYLAAEEKVVISKKESMFSWDETTSKVPARLTLQVWDADHFSKDDFLGAITMDLNRFPRGAKTAKKCTSDMLKTDGTVPTINLFKQKRTKGWWPLYIKTENEGLLLQGKVEAELSLHTAEEAEKMPAGLGRDDPNGLEKPTRPDSSFMWFVNPIKSIRYIIWHNYKWTIVKLICWIGLLLFLILFFYALPGYSIKKMLGA